MGRGGVINVGWKAGFFRRVRNGKNTFSVPKVLLNSFHHRRRKLC